jgi:hypothetical protein
MAIDANTAAGAWGKGGAGIVGLPVCPARTSQGVHMGTQFKFDNVYRAPSVAEVLKAYWDPDHLATQDKLANLCDREVVEDLEVDGTRKTTWKVASTRTLPMIVKPFVSNGRLTFLEIMTVKHGEHLIEAKVQPQILNGRVHIDSTYKLSQVGEGQVLRTYAGTIHANITLLSGRIEKGILEAFDKEMPTMTKCTQDWLDRTCNAR